MIKTFTIDTDKWQLVPVEPSEDMLRKAIKVDLGKDCDEKGICINLYQVMLAAAPQPHPNHNWCAGCSPDNCSGCGAEPVDSEPAMWVMKHIRSGDLAQAKPNQKALHPYMWSDAFPRYTTPQPVRTAELEAALNEARDFESDVDTVTQHNVELQLETIALKSALNVARDALIDCEGALDECRDYPITYDTILEALAKINEVLK